MAPTAGSDPSADAKRHLANWQDEIDSVALYGALADLETDPRLADVYRRLAAVEDRHAGFWEDRLKASGATVPQRRPGWRTRMPRMGLGAERARARRAPARDRGARDRGDPRRGARELALIYEAKGLPAEPARELAGRQMADRTTALDTMAREELGIDPAELGGSAAIAAIGEAIGV
jgi:hypothetical protein